MCDAASDVLRKAKTFPPRSEGSATLARSVTCTGHGARCGGRGRCGGLGRAARRRRPAPVRLPPQRTGSGSSSWAFLRRRIETLFGRRGTMLRRLGGNSAQSRLRYRSPTVSLRMQTHLEWAEFPSSSTRRSALRSATGLDSELPLRRRDAARLVPSRRGRDAAPRTLPIQNFAKACRELATTRGKRVLNGQSFRLREQQALFLGAQRQRSIRAGTRPTRRPRSDVKTPFGSSLAFVASQRGSSGYIARNVGASRTESLPR
jgi:hypothetical protein